MNEDVGLRAPGVDRSSEPIKTSGLPSIAKTFITLCFTASLRRPASVLIRPISSC
jgi:hypothetical protein